MGDLKARDMDPNTRVTLKLGTWILHTTHRLGMSNKCSKLFYNMSIHVQKKVIAKHTDGCCDFKHVTFEA